MTTSETILRAFAPDEELTSAQLCERTGFDISRVCTYLGRLRDRELLERVDAALRPVKHRLAGAARTRAQQLASMPRSDDPDGSILGNAKRQPASVFDLGRVAC